MTEEEFSKLIDSLKVDLQLFEEMIREVARDIVRNGFSTYPVFVASTQEIKMGELIMEKDTFSANFNIYATTLEEMIKMKLVLESKREEFIRAYKNPSRFMCVMLITTEIASFVFFPYSKGGDV